MEQEKRIAVMAIIVENRDSVEELNTLLHEYGNYIVGRMGLPYEKKNLHIVSIALDAPNDTISALAGKIGNISGISVKTFPRSFFRLKARSDIFLISKKKTKRVSNSCTFFPKSII